MPHLSSRTIAELMDTAARVATVGGTVAKRRFRDDDLTTERKADDSPVTEADRGAERVMRAAITRRFPDHAILGEEYGGEIPAHGFVWVLDPIDGTKTFVRGVPLYTTLVAVLHDRTPIVGVIFNPGTGESLVAGVGAGAWNERGRRVAVSGRSELATAWFACTDPTDLLQRRGAGAIELIRRAAATRTWADAYGYLLVARGDLDLMVDPIMAPWDVAPLGIIVREAGGYFRGIDDDVPLPTSAIAASSRELGESALQLLRDHREP